MTVLLHNSTIAICTQPFHKRSRTLLQATKSIHRETMKEQGTPTLRPITSKRKKFIIFNHTREMYPLNYILSRQFMPAPYKTMIILSYLHLDAKEVNLMDKIIHKAISKLNYSLNNSFHNVRAWVPLLSMMRKQPLHWVIPQ